MKTLHCCIFLLLALTISVEARTWTAKSGHTMDGEFVMYENEIVFILLLPFRKKLNHFLYHAYYIP